MNILEDNAFLAYMVVRKDCLFENKDEERAARNEGNEKPAFIVGKKYHTSKAQLYDSGFHSLILPTGEKIHRPEEDRYVKVRVWGDVCASDDYTTTICSTDIEILRELSNEEFLSREEFENAIFWFNGYKEFLCKTDDMYLIKSVDREGKETYNFLNDKGELLSEDGFIKAYEYNEGFGRVEIKPNEWNFLNKEGKTIFKNNYRYLYSFHEGLAGVQLNDKMWSFIKPSEELFKTGDQFKYYAVRDFRNGISAVQYSETDTYWVTINKEGEKVKS